MRTKRKYMHSYNYIVITPETVPETNIKYYITSDDVKKFISFLKYYKRNLYFKSSSKYMERIADIFQVKCCACIEFLCSILHCIIIYSSRKFFKYDSFVYAVFIQIWEDILITLMDLCPIIYWTYRYNETKVIPFKLF